jgi:hypothetical protein
MAAKSQTEFASSVSLRVTESAANTLTFQKIEGGVTTLDKVGWVIQKCFFSLSNPVYFNGTGDIFTIALTVSNKLADLSVDNPGVIFSRTFERVDMGAAASAQIIETTQETDFSSLQGGGVLVLPTPLYLACQGQGLSNAMVGLLRMYFFPIQMADSDYFNLVQSRQILINS